LVGCLRSRLTHSYIDHIVVYVVRLHGLELDVKLGGECLALGGEWLDLLIKCKDRRAELCCATRSSTARPGTTASVSARDAADAVVTSKSEYTAGAGGATVAGAIATATPSESTAVEREAAFECEAAVEREAAFECEAAVVAAAPCAIGVVSPVAVVGECVVGCITIECESRSGTCDELLGGLLMARGGRKGGRVWESGGAKPDQKVVVVVEWGTARDEGRVAQAWAHCWYLGMRDASVRPLVWMKV
jgi:hypothetical protein